MWGKDSSGGTLVGAFVILLLLFAIFNGRGSIFGTNAVTDGVSAGFVAQANTFNQIENNQATMLAKIDCNKELAEKDLELATRTILNNSDNNKNDILLADEKRENQNLRDRVLRLEAEGDKKDILLAIERSHSATAAEIADVRCNMLPKPQVTGIGCSSCVVSPNSCGSNPIFG